MNFFYSKFALNNLVKNKKFVLPYVLSAIFTIISFYILSSLALGKNLDTLPDGVSTIKKVLYFGVVVIAIFSAIFLFYTYSFLIKRRVREFGLYSVLGMTKKQIARILLLETIFIAALTIVLGLVLGMLFDKLLLLSLLKLFEAGISFGFNVTRVAIILTILVFGGIYFLLLIYTIIKVSRLKIVALLKEENKGEREPKARWILAIIGLALIGYGYYTAQTVKNPVKAISLFFFAVIAVMLGTYPLFMSVSIAVLKIMKNNKYFYYKPKNFISISGLLYRMKRNSVGLANICILSTMVLVTMGTTSALYVGSEASYEARYPRDIAITRLFSNIEKLEEIKEKVKQATKEAGVEIKDEIAYNQLDIIGKIANNKFEITNDNVDLSSADKLNVMFVVNLEDYNKIAKEKKTLDSSEALLYVDKKGVYNYNDLIIQGITYKIKEKLSKYPVEIRSAIANIMDTYYLIVKDNTEVKKLSSKVNEVLRNKEERSINNHVVFNISDKTKEKKVIENFRNLEKNKPVEIEGKSKNKVEFRAFFASFLFIGIFISMIFVLSQVVIMYFKQITEGYEDKGKFEIMRKVGLTNKQIKQSIRSQVLLIFFSPLIIATIHTAVAYPFIEKILKLFLVTDNNIFLIAMFATIGIFTIFYLIVYLITSRMYYKIIKE